MPELGSVCAFVEFFDELVFFGESESFFDESEDERGDYFLNSLCEEEFFVFCK